MRFILALLLSYVPVAALAATEQHADESGGALPQFNVETAPSQLFWLFIMFVFVYFFVRNMVIPQIATSIERRDDHVRGQLQEAGALNEKARVLQDEYETSMSDAHKKASETAQKARGEIAAKLAMAENAQRDVFAKKRDQFMKSYETKRADIIKDLEAESKALSKAFAEKLLSTSSTATKSKKAA